MKKIIVLLMLAVSTVSVAQDKQITFEDSKDYKELLLFYKQTMESGKQLELDLLRKEYLNKFGQSSFQEMSASGLSMDKWLEKNIKKTNFKSIEEANTLLAKMEKLELVLKEDRKKIEPIFTRLSKEVGTAALFKKISEDLKTVIKL
ncbi:hypothetical protein [Paenimyroides aestuarii]|uniref:Uncharacterized protein n=1 Tax=Paenimyroides aestuarii TaxID=2968490 RepID=A0ABY5NNU6_9FLAO|nr:hypothetical protein [Paenimyroides aestuarii]UUV20206.1 hypothetical protein NPX36_07465 [Paenimyroides aestuarii]